MADDASNPDDNPVTFHIKSTADSKYTVSVPLSMSVLELKEKLAGSEYADIPPERQRLIYSGRVLKDPDPLSSYKIKEGNTVHLVKSAASNARQNPTGAAASGASAAGSAQGVTGVPTNLAAGTGRDPLAALTGARYAGFTQMPNANMFGPDGGMGPPPDPEQMASMLENPAFSSQLNEALSNPEVVEQMIRSNPMLQGQMGQQARQMLQDPNFRRMMTDPETLRNMNQMRRTMPGLFGGMGGTGGPGGANEAFPMPGSTDVDTPSGGNGQDGQRQQPGTNPNAPPNPFASLFGGAGGLGNPGADPFAMLFPGGMPGMNPPAGAQGQNNATTGTNDTNTTDSANPQSNTQPTPPPQFLAALQMLNQMNAAQQAQQPGSQPTSGTTPSTDPSSNPQQQQQQGAAPMFNPFAALQALRGMGLNPGDNPAGLDFNNMFGGQQNTPEDTRPPEDRYAEQLRQLNDMGFYEFERNVEALRRTGGSVQGAVEYLLSHS